VAVAVLLEFDVDVALIAHDVVDTGAVNSPELLIEPHVVDQVTDALAVNCCVPIACSETDEGVTVNCPAVTTDPDSATVCGLFVAESVKLNVAVRVPVAVGLNTTEAAQFPAAARLVPHVLLEMLKSPAFVPLIATLEIVTDALVLFDSVAACELLLVPTAEEVNVRLVGLDVTLPVLPAPEPVSVTLCGLFVAESVKLNVAVRVPVAVGLNTTDAVQLPDAARLVPHVLLEMLKSPAFVPLIATVEIVTDALVPLASVAACDALLVPTAVEANVRVVGLAPTPPGAKPVSVTTCGLLVAESVKLSVADRFPDSCGANATLAVQLAEAASVVPHVFEEILKSPGFVPPSAILLMFNVVVPLFVRVAAFAAPVFPIVTETQLIVVGLTEALPDVVADPVPVNATACGLFVAESVKLSVAVRAPDAVGLKITAAEQLAAAARLAPQLFDEILKSPAFVPVIATPLIVIDALVPFASVDDIAELLDPTLTLPNESEVGLADTDPAAAPVPVNATFCGLLLAESVKLNVAVRVPDAVGLKITAAAQVCDAATLVLQEFVEILKSPAFVPVIATPLMVIAVLVPFVSVEDIAELLDPTLRLPNESDVGLTVTDAAAAPVPVSVIVCGLLLAESVKFSVAERTPVAVGLNAIFAVQLDEAPSVDPQVLLSILKSPGSAPASATLLIVIEAEPLLVSVTTFCAPVLPRTTDTQFNVAGDTDACACNAVPLETRHAPASNARVGLEYLARIARTGSQEKEYNSRRSGDVCMDGALQGKSCMSQLRSNF
jgi:hypothetical protein